MKIPPSLPLACALSAILQLAATAAEVTLIDEGASCDYLVPSVANGGSSLGLTWTGAADPANFASWTKGATTGIGYDEQTTYVPFIATDVAAEMNDRHSTIYIRLPFEIADPSLLSSITRLTLNMRVDDGFIAYLNGVRVAAHNPPAAAPNWDSVAGGTTADSTAVQLVPFDLSPFLGELRTGANLLAIHGLNAGNTSSDFLISPQLVADNSPPPLPLPQPRLVGISNGFERPVDIQHAGDGSGRLFVVEKPGRVRIVTADGQLLPTPFLNISGPVDDGDNEEGLLGLAFPPDFADKQHFYVYYTGPVAPGGGGVTSDSILSRFSVSANNPDVADPASEEVILRVGQPFWNHNAGQIQFGPKDGYLYIAFGDGGSGNDPGNRAQNRQLMLGKLLRLDVEGTPDVGRAYAIPPTNPFVGDATTLDEIWAYGLRNPFRFSFDRLNGDLFIGDVGQGAWEEMDFEPAGSPGGRNYGWRWWEGDHQAVTSGQQPPNVTFPVHEYDSNGGNCSIISGYVYRGSRFPRMAGIHFFGDYCNGDLRALRRDGDGQWEATSLLQLGFSPTSFGEDEAGNLYVAADAFSNTMSLFRIEDSRDQNYLTNIATGSTADGRPTFTFGTAIGKRYQLQVSPDLEAWQDVGPAVAATGFSLTFELPAANSGNPRQFMRAGELN